jgi:hypothetical protein
MAHLPGTIARQHKDWIVAGLATPWAALLDDDDIRRGRIWVAVLVMVLIAPRLTARKVSWA